MKKILEVLELGTEYLNKHSIESARLNMQIILCSVLNLNKIDLYTQYDKPLTAVEVDIIREAMVQRSSGKPLQYVLNKGHFLDNSLQLNDSVLIPRPETEELVSNAIKENRNDDAVYSILDIGTGSGCIAISMAKAFKNSMIYAIDIDERAIETAKNNAKINNVDNIRFHLLNILDKIPQTKFDIIISNPPYINFQDYEELDNTVKKFEPKIALTDGGDGFAFYRRYAEIFPKMLTKTGKFYLEFGFGQKKEIIDIFAVTNLQINVSKDSAGIDRILSGYRLG